MVRVRVPASTANLGCGYDTFGMALGYYNIVAVEPAAGFSCTVRGEGEGRLPLNERNLTVRAAAAAYEAAGEAMPPLALCCENHIPLSRGMGSSSAAIVGGIYAANVLMGEPLSADELLALATRLEGHPDNVAPALRGGFTVVAQETGQLFCRRLPVPDGLRGVLAVPGFPVSTKKARAILPRQVELADAVFNLSHAAALALALAQGDLAGFGAMLNDRLHQPYRFQLIPGAADVVEAAIAAGALGCTLSGSGSTMISFSEDDDMLRDNIAAAMREAFQEHGVECRILFLKMDNRGVCLF